MKTNDAFSLDFERFIASLFTKYCWCNSKYLANLFKLIFCVIPKTLEMLATCFVWHDTLKSVSKGMAYPLIHAQLITIQSEDLLKSIVVCYVLYLGMR